MLMKARIQAKFEKFSKQKDNSRKLLENYKSWGDPCVSAGELQTSLLAKSEIQDRIVKVDLAYFSQTHKYGMIAGHFCLSFTKYQMRSGLKTWCFFFQKEIIPVNLDVSYDYQRRHQENQERCNNFTIRDKWFVHSCLGCWWKIALVSWLSKHCTENNIFFFRTPWKDGLSKQIALEHDLSCIIVKDNISFFRKYDLTP